MWLTTLNLSNLERKRMIRRIRESIQKNSKLWGFGLYGWLSLLGMLYARSYYQSFEVNIFDFVELPDFLLMAFSKAGIVLGIGLGIGLVGAVVVCAFRFLLFVLRLILIRRYIKIHLVFAVARFKSKIFLFFRFVKRWSLFVIPACRVSWRAALDAFTDSRHKGRTR